MPLQLVVKVAEVSCRFCLDTLFVRAPRAVLELIIENATFKSSQAIPRRDQLRAFEKRRAFRERRRDRGTKVDV